MLSQMKLTYYCDDSRHLICTPYTIENLHRMAEELNIKRNWFHPGSNFPHYDIPKKRVEEIQEKCIVVDARRLVELIKQQIILHGIDTGIPKSRRKKNLLQRVNLPLGVKAVSFRTKVVKVRKRT